MRACARVHVLQIEKRLINEEGACKIPIFSCVCQLKTVPEEEEVDYLNEKLDHDHWIIT